MSKIFRYLLLILITQLLFGCDAGPDVMEDNNIKPQINSFDISVIYDSFPDTLYSNNEIDYSFGSGKIDFKFDISYGRSEDTSQVELYISNSTTIDASAINLMEYTCDNSAELFTFNPNWCSNLDQTICHYESDFNFHCNGDEDVNYRERTISTSPLFATQPTAEKYFILHICQSDGCDTTYKKVLYRNLI
ncbi:MAG: hypothetical protein OEZ58_22375 [Gammaproteobacteria bacterium]|nr:hypothetical protein [Gammaproteobacteria bacterium]